jgi:beta-galactosidase
MFNVAQPASTFLDMRNFGMGVVWVNGHNLGRHWDRGGLRSLFLSQHFLRSGQNEIVVLELHDAPKSPTIASSTKIIEESPVPFPIKLDQRVPAPASQPAGRRGQ